jgi:hypothetical protein
LVLRSALAESPRDLLLRRLQQEFERRAHVGFDQAKSKVPDA